MTDKMKKAGLHIYYMFANLWKTFVVVEKWKMKNEWCIKEQQTINY